MSSAPPSFLSLALDVQIAGSDAAVHHRVNLSLHLLGTALAFLFFLKLTRLPLVAGMVAAVFCIHPMHAESVAWISERKDVLSTLLVLGTLNLYLAWKLLPRGRWEMDVVGRAVVLRPRLPRQADGRGDATATAVD